MYLDTNIFQISKVSPVKFVSTHNLEQAFQKMIFKKNWTDRNNDFSFMIKIRVFWEVKINQLSIKKKECAALFHLWNVKNWLKSEKISMNPKKKEKNRGRIMKWFTLCKELQLSIAKNKKNMMGIWWSIRTHFKQAINWVVRVLIQFHFFSRCFTTFFWWFCSNWTGWKLNKMNMRSEIESI